MSFSRPTKDQARVIVQDLCERFAKQLSVYKGGAYNETQTRRDFIDPFFKALGWDIDNQQGSHEAYREVIHEDAVKVDGKQKAPDYSFRLGGGQRLFFVEAKKPSVNVKDDVAPAYQVRRYGWNAKLSVSILTDFEEFALYDCSKKPKPTDKTGIARVEYFRFTDYLERFDFLWDTFSYEGVRQGGLLGFNTGKAKKGTTTVDLEFLGSLDTWRVMLADDISSHRSNKPILDSDKLNNAVQMLLDRIIFLRICEDRGVEPDGLLRDTIGTQGCYNKMLALFHTADQKYNSGLFDLERDGISKHLEVSDKVLKDIAKQLYYPECPYEFSVLSVEILGSAYERFLGKTITLNGHKKAEIEEKPEVRKAGGVYYTPQYIVEYIVRNTVGPLVQGKTPAQVAELKIVDQACGSGSFLLGAYQFLLEWHREYFIANPKEKYSVAGKKKTQSIDALNPDQTLTSAVKKQILLNNIYGVDLDAQAVEVTKLSLLLKCLEGETKASLQLQQSLFHDRILPTLDKNIHCGNSLIGFDALSFQPSQGELLPDNGASITNKPFDWQAAFPQVFAQGGFDAVIGNPPYVRQEMLTAQKPYYQAHYEVYHGVADLYSYFFEKGIKLLNDKGQFSIIVANKWMRANYGEPLRKWLKAQHLVEIVDFGDLPVFDQATTYPCIITVQRAPLGKGKASKSTLRVAEVKTLDFVDLQTEVDRIAFALEQSNLDDGGWSLAPKAQQDLMEKLRGPSFVKLGDYVKGEIYRGVLTGLNEAFVIDAATRDALIAEDKRSAEVIKPFLAGRDVKRYAPLGSEKYLIFTRRGIDIKQYPAILRHLKAFRTQLEPKPKDFKGDDWPGRKPGPYAWYEIQDSIDYYEKFDGVKIIYPNICARPEFSFDTTGWYTNQKCFIIPGEDLYLLGVFNSSFMYFLFEQFLPKLRGGFFEPSSLYFLQFPLPANPPKATRESMVKKVEQMLALHRDLAQATPAAQERIRQHIAVIDREIDQLVYGLYGLTADEVKVVEGVG